MRRIPVVSGAPSDFLPLERGELPLRRRIQDTAIEGPEEASRNAFLPLPPESRDPRDLRPLRASALRGLRAPWGDGGAVC